jgi:hypothetical protein
MLIVSPFPVSSEWAATAPGEQQSTPQPGADESQQDSACFALSSFSSISFSPNYGILCILAEQHNPPHILKIFVRPFRLLVSIGAQFHKKTG